MRTPLTLGITLEEFYSINRLFGGSAAAWAALGLISYTNESNEFNYSIVPSPDLVDTANQATSWTPLGNNTITQSGDVVVVTYVDNSGGASVDLNALGGLSEDLVVGEKYILQITARSTGNGGSYIDLSGVSSWGIPLGDFKEYTAFLTAGASNYIDFIYFSTDDIVEIKDIRVVLATRESILTNQGSGLTTYDGLNHSGESLEIGSTQRFSLSSAGKYSAVYDTTFGAWYHRTNAYTILAGTYGHMVVLGKEPSIADKVIMDANPHVLVDLLFDRATELTSIVKADIENFYIPNVLQGGLLQDLATPLGTNEVVNGTFDIDSDWTKGTGWTISSGQAHSDGTTAFLQQDSLTVGSTYRITLDLTITSGSFSVLVSGSEVASLGTSGTHTFVGEATSSGVLAILSVSGIGSIDNIVAEEVNVITIPNYSDTMYTNADQNPQGQQTTNITFDGTGLATGVTYDTMDWGGNHYLDTQINPPSNSAWSIDLALYFDTTEPSDKWCGFAGTVTTATLYLGYLSSGNKLTGKIGNTWLGFTVPPAVATGWHFISLEYDGLGGGNFIVNDTHIEPFSASGYTQDVLQSFFLGVTSRDSVFYAYPSVLPTGYFQYTEGTRTAEDRTAAYNAAKLQHPTLP